jgi:hypothetical protein
VGHHVWITKHTKGPEKHEGGFVTFVALRGFRGSEAHEATAGEDAARVRKGTMVRKIKRKRNTEKLPRPKGLTPGMRMKGGVRFDPEINGFVAIVHVWDNVYCHGEPEEWRYTEVFPSEEAAMRYYKETIRPALERMLAETTDGRSDRAFIHRKLEE